MGGGKGPEARKVARHSTFGDDHVLRCNGSRVSGGGIPELLESRVVVGVVSKKQQKWGGGLRAVSSNLNYCGTGGGAEGSDDVGGAGLGNGCVDVRDSL